MTDADNSPRSYSEDWLRQRGAKYNPLTGQIVAQPRLVRDLSPPDKTTGGEAEQSKLAPTSPDKQQKPPLSESPVVSGGGETGASVHRPATSGAQEYPAIPEVPSPRSKLPVFIGLVLAIVAVVAAEHYVVPMFTHTARTDLVKQAAPSSGIRQPETNTTRTSIPPLPKDTIVKSAQQNIKAPEVPTNGPQVTAAPSPAPITPVQATSVQATPPANTIVKSSAAPRTQEEYPAPETQPAPAQHHGESNAQYEQQHLNQLMSPLG